MKKPSVLPLMLASGLGAMSYGTIFTIVDDLRDKYGISASRLGLIMGVGFFAGFVSNVFLAPYADRGHAKRMIMIGIVVQLLGVIQRCVGAHLIDRVCCGHDERVAVVGAEVRHAVVDDRLHRLRCSAESRQGQAAEIGRAHV